MCLIILPKDDRVLEWSEAVRERKKALRENRRRILFKMLPCLRPAVTDGPLPQEDVKPPQYASKNSLPLKKEVVGSIAG